MFEFTITGGKSAVHHLRRSPRNLFAGFLLIWLAGSNAIAQGLPCGPSNEPAASLLLPYFEVDVSAGDGPSTLFSVGSVALQPTLAHAVVWSNWGHPVYSFDFVVPSGGLQTFNVRDILSGMLPTPSPGPLSAERFPNCTLPLTQPAVDPEDLIDQLSGRPSADDGLCYAGPPPRAGLVTGFVTVDVVQDCSGTTLMSSDDASYMGDCATGLAGNDNVLWGDFFLVDPGNDSAQGDRLVAFTADQSRFGVPFFCVDPPCGWRVEETFQPPEGNRMPLARTYQTRFLQGGGFDGGTDLIYWVDGRWGPTVCDSAPGSNPGAFFQATYRSEDGTPIGETLVFPSRATGRLAVGGTELPVPESFGVIDISAFFSPTGSGLEDADPRQLYVLPQMTALGRYSVGLSTLPTADFCSEE